VFIEGGTFKTIIPLPDGKAIAVSDTVEALPLLGLC